jgi:hypothetical protein
VVIKNVDDRAVEAFVSEKKMTRLLGGSGFREVILGTIFGAASSSCSFGAVATANRVHPVFEYRIHRVVCGSTGSPFSKFRQKLTAQIPRDPCVF